MSTAIAAIQTLMEFMKRNSGLKHSGTDVNSGLTPCNLVAETIAELTSDLKGAMVELQTSDQSVASVASGCELFLRFITLTALDKPVRIVCTRLLCRCTSQLVCFMFLSFLVQAVAGGERYILVMFLIIQNDINIRLLD